MLVEVSLKNLLDTNVMFYLDDEFRDKLFSDLHKKYKDWRIVAKNIGIHARQLFGIRRGFETHYGIKHKIFVSSREIISLSKLNNKNLSYFQEYIREVKLGTSGRNFKINLSFIVDLNISDIHSKERMLAELVYISKSKNKLEVCGLGQEQYFSITAKEINRLRKDTYEDRPLPNKIVFDEIFAKEFGKWIGDRCGGPRKVGVCNKNIEFILSFKKFLISLKQGIPKIELTLNKDFNPDNNLKKYADKISISNTQYGDYAYRVEVSNRILKEYVFDYFENNIDSVLSNSPRKVRYAFFAGLIEAEGSIDPEKCDISIAFGIQTWRDNEKIINILQKSIMYRNLLNLDGFNSYISRKYCNTEKSSTLKYDIRLKRDSFIKFKQKIVPFINHEEKLEKIRRLEKRLTKTNKKDNLVPEISIGLVGH